MPSDIARRSPEWRPDIGSTDLGVRGRENAIRAAGCHECGSPYTDDDSIILNMATGYSKHGNGCPAVVDA